MTKKLTGVIEPAEVIPPGGKSQQEKLKDYNDIASHIINIPIIYGFYPPEEREQFYPILKPGPLEQLIRPTPGTEDVKFNLITDASDPKVFE